MRSSLLKSLVFAPLQIHSQRSPLSRLANVHGARVPIGPRGIYVGFGATGFHYSRKDRDEQLTQPAEGSPATSIHATSAYRSSAEAHTARATEPRAGLEQATPDGVAAEIEHRASQLNLFHVYLSVSGGVLLFSLAVPALFVVLLIGAGVGAFFVHRWDRERRTTRLFYDVDSDEIVNRLAIGTVAGEVLARAARLWCVLGSEDVWNTKYHAGAGRLTQRTPAWCGVATIDGLELNVRCTALQMGAQQLVFLPDRLLIRYGKRVTAIGWEYLEATHRSLRFIEDGHVPPDSQIVDTTWRYVNKSGGPDLRFNNNTRLPVVDYGELTIRSSTGFHLVLQSSQPLAAKHAALAIQELARIAREGALQVTAPQMPPEPRHAPPPLPAGQTPSGQRPAPPPLPRSSPSPIASSAVVSAPLAPAARHASVAEQPRPDVPNPFLENWAANARAEQDRERELALQRIGLQKVSVGIRPVPPPLPIHRPAARIDVHHPAKAVGRFFGKAEQLQLAGRTIPSPLTYVAEFASAANDASTVVSTLPVGNGAHALPLPYWPSYASADPDQRARYLDWMAGGRQDPSVPIGYVFIFFYGLERRVLVDGLDEEIAAAEVRRLLGVYGENRSFRAYASDFLAFAPLRREGSLLAMTETELVAKLGSLAHESATALAGVAAWHHLHRQALPAHIAATIASGMESAKRGAVVTRSATELLDLFTIRYRDSFGDGLQVEPSKRPLTIAYRPASATLLTMARSLTVTLPDALGRVGQFRKLVALWNDCVDDLRKASAKKRGAKALDAAAWSALPAELRAEYDHPDQDRWDAAVAKLPILAGFHLTEIGQLAVLTGIERSEKLTPAQLKKIAARAADVGYAMEPEPRVRTKGMEWRSEVLVWRSPNTEAPDAKLYGSVSAMLSLAMTVAMADGIFTPEEQEAVNSFLAELFTLDSEMLTRVEAIKQLMARDSRRLDAVAKTLRATRTPKELAKLAAVLVAIAAADGTIAETEEKALRTLYRNLGLPAADLAAAITKTGARLERDAAVEVQPASPGAGGVPIPRPPEEAPKLRLDRAAIDAIVADTRDVAAILSEVFEAADEAGAPESAPEPSSSHGQAPAAKLVELPRASEATAALAEGLDVRYHAALEELLSRDAWAQADVRHMAERHRLMPGAILDTINAWSDDFLGDFLIEETGGEWKINRELAMVDK